MSKMDDMTMRVMRDLVYENTGVKVVSVGYQSPGSCVVVTETGLHFVGKDLGEVVENIKAWKAAQ